MKHYPIYAKGYKIEDKDVDKLYKVTQLTNGSTLI
jgi:hypothetical protein